MSRSAPPEPARSDPDMTTRTPQLTEHARARCAEMGISTKVAKRIVMKADATYPGKQSYDQKVTIALSRVHPEYAVVYVMRGDQPVIVTVMFNTPDYYERAGTTFIPREDPEEWSVA